MGRCPHLPVKGLTAGRGAATSPCRCVPLVSCSRRQPSGGSVSLPAASRVLSGRPVTHHACTSFSEVCAVRHDVTRGGGGSEGIGRGVFRGGRRFLSVHSFILFLLHSISPFHAPSLSRGLSMLLSLSSFFFFWRHFCRLHLHCFRIPLIFCSLHPSIPFPCTTSMPGTCYAVFFTITLFIFPFILFSLHPFIPLPCSTSMPGTSHAIFFTIILWFVAPLLHLHLFWPLFLSLLVVVFWASARFSLCFLLFS